MDSNENHAEMLTRSLERHGHSVTRCRTDRDLLRYLAKHGERFEVVILDLSANRPGDWKALDQIRRLCAMHVTRPTVLCISRTYRGPRTKLDVERRGARLVYER